jgi:Kef-type K+ transport system membrane component KefB
MVNVAPASGVVAALVLVLMFVAAAITEAPGFHALLGAFVFGVLLSQAPRDTEDLRSRCASAPSTPLSPFCPFWPRLW